MSFANPLLWLGALGLAIPVWLHLVRWWRHDVRRFPTLRFLDDEPIPRRQPMRLRDPLLLALRALALLLVVAAFAGPWLRDRRAAPVVESRVHVLDDTLSRQADGGVTRDVERIRRAIQSAGSGVQDAVVVLGAHPRVVAGFGDTHEQALAALADVRPTAERGPYLEAFRLASRLLAQALGERHRILFYGDSQANQWGEHETAAPFLEGIDVEVVDPPAVPERPNLFVTEPAAQRLFSGSDAFVDVTLRLGHQGPAGSAVAALRVNGQEVLRRPVVLAGEPFLIDLKAQWKDDPSRWVTGEVSIEGTPDALSVDDHAYFALPPVTEGRVALLAHSSYLRAALSPDVVRGRWKVTELDPSQPAAQLTGTELLDVLVVESDYLPSQGVRDLVLRWLDNGRGVLLTVSRVTPLVSGVLRQLGFEAEEVPPTDTAFRFLATEHPVFRPFFSAEMGGLGDVHVRSPVRLRATGGTGLAFGADGNGLVFEGTRGGGRLLVTAFSLDRAETTWPLLPSFVPFLDVALTDLRRGTAVETSVEPGMPHVLALPPDAHVREVVIRQGERVVSRSPVEHGRARVMAPPAPGLYTVTWDQGTDVRHVLAVNPSPRESELRYADKPIALAAWRTSAPVKTPAAAEAGVTRWRAAADQRLWWWCLLAAMVLLAAETLLAARGRKAAAPGLARAA